MKKKYDSLEDFYEFYLTQHESIWNRRLHFFGTTLFLSLCVYIVYSVDYGYILALPVVGYGFAWVGHFFIEKNVPATFTYPVYSFVCDFVMCKDMLVGKIRLI